jgi:hypothetical protein
MSSNNRPRTESAPSPPTTPILHANDQRKKTVAVSPIIKKAVEKIESPTQETKEDTTHLQEIAETIQDIPEKSQETKEETTEPTLPSNKNIGKRAPKKNPIRDRQARAQQYEEQKKEREENGMASDNITSGRMVFSL